MSATTTITRLENLVMKTFNQLTLAIVVSLAVALPSVKAEEMSNTMNGMGHGGHNMSGMDHGNMQMSAEDKKPEKKKTDMQQEDHSGHDMSGMDHGSMNMPATDQKGGNMNQMDHRSMQGMDHGASSTKNSGGMSGMDMGSMQGGRAPDDARDRQRDLTFCRQKTVCAWVMNTTSLRCG